jgi:hypothetical protein
LAAEEPVIEPEEMPTVPPQGGIGWMGFAAAALIIIAVVAVVCAIIFHPAAKVIVEAPASPSVPAVIAPAAKLVSAPPSPDVRASAEPRHRFGDFDQQEDIGDVGHRGYVEFHAGQHQYRVTSCGSDIYNKIDAFHFVWREMSGDLTMKADITFDSPGDEPTRKGVLMVRQSLDAGSPFADVAVDGNGLISLQFRLKPNEAAQQKATKTRNQTVWLERRKNVFTLYTIDPGQKRAILAKMAVPMRDPVYVGIGTGSHSDTRSETATFSNLSLTPGARDR